MLRQLRLVDFPPLVTTTFPVPFPTAAKTATLDFQLQQDFSKFFGDWATDVKFQRKRSSVGEIDKNCKQVDGVLVCTTEGQLLALCEGVSIWVSKAPLPLFTGDGPCVCSCVDIKVGRNIGGVAGMIVTLSESGRLTVSYLGTSPEDVQSILEDSTHTHGECNNLSDEHYGVVTSLDESNDTRTGRYLSIKVEEIPSCIDDDVSCVDDDNAALHLARTSQGKLCRVSLTIQLCACGGVPATDVKLLTKCAASLVIPKPEHYIGDLEAGESGRVCVEVLIRSDMLCVSLQLLLYASCTTVVKDITQTSIATCIAKLPFSLAATRIRGSPFTMTDSPYKLVLNSNEEWSENVQSLTKTFEDVPFELDDDIQIDKHDEIFFKYRNGDYVGVSVMPSGKIMLFSEHFPTLLLLMTEVLERLEYLENTQLDTKHTHKQLHNKRRRRAFFRSGLPLMELFQEIDTYYDTRREYTEILTELKKVSRQHRAVQRRLVVRFLDSAAPPLNHLDVILDFSFQRIVQLCDQAIEVQPYLMRAAERLHSALALTVTLMCLRWDLGEAYKDELERLLDCTPHSGGPSGGCLLCGCMMWGESEEDTGGDKGERDVSQWDDRVSAALTSTLKERGEDITDTLMDQLFPDKIELLKKRITSLVDLVASKGSIWGVDPLNDTARDIKVFRPHYHSYMSTQSQHVTIHTHTHTHTHTHNEIFSFENGWRCTSDESPGHVDVLSFESKEEELVCGDAVTGSDSYRDMSCSDTYRMGEN
eukprot:GHVR01083743.1.p1 GENE.GHVR01083743.1~~GHVR01083743.1.p1  ORF type:complete len:759 (+),score=215.58 GHVR01083743.1:1098-3374(+)